MNEQADTRPDLRCYYHPEREATSQCDRCGDYLCDDCVRTLVGEHVCVTCYDRHFSDRTLREMGEAAVGVAGRLLGLIALIVILVLLVIVTLAVFGFLWSLYI